MNRRKVIAITQARVGSSRLPGKVLKTIQGTELLKIHLERVGSARMIDKVVVATTVEPGDDQIADLCSKWGIEFGRGSEADVLDRYYQVAKPFSPDYIVRVTSDCPLIDPDMIDGVVGLALANNLDYAANIMTEKFPDGQDVEVIKFSALEKAWNETNLKSDREHVTPYVRNNSSFKGGNLFSSMDFPAHDNYAKVRMTVDEATDFEVIRILVENLGYQQSWKSYADYINEHDLNALTVNNLRNAGYLKSLENDEK